MTCQYCNDTKLVPFIKDGKTISNTFLDCICKVDEPEQYHEITVDNFDFPCSQSFREFTFEQYGRPWEQRHEIYQPEEPPAEAPASQPWDQRQQHQIDQTRAEIKRLAMKVAALTGEKPKPAQAGKPKYKGLVVNNE